MDRTPWNPQWSVAVERVTSLVESLFSCRVKFQTLETFLDRREDGEAPLYLAQDLVFLESTMFEPPAVIRGTRPGMFAFPLRVRRAGAPARDVSLVGVASIEGLAASDDERLHMLGEFLQMATESRLDAFERLLDVEREERDLLERSEVRENAKIVRLFPKASTASTEPFQLRPYRDELILTRPLLIVGSQPHQTARSFKEPFPFNRIALEIFNRTSLWFFVNIADLSDEAFQSAQAFRDLGRMCIFIPDLATVSIEHQLRIAEVVGSEHADSPRLISVVHEAPVDLVRRGVVLPHLLELLTVVEIGPTIASDLPAEPIPQMIRSFVQNLEDQLKGPVAPALIVETKGSNLIHLIGRKRPDDGSNPTFH